MRATTLMLAMVITAVAFTAPANAKFEMVSRAYEVRAHNFSAPTTANSGVVLRECSSCDRLALRVTSATSYSFGGQTMSLDRFRSELGSAPVDDVTLTVLHHLESDTVLRISATVRVELTR